MKSKDDRKMIPVKAFIGLNHMEKLVYWSKIKKLPMSRLIAIALDKEFDEVDPFLYDCSLPSEEFEEYAYADQAGKILRYLKDQSVGMSIEMLTLLRADYGVPDKSEMLAGLKECVDKDLIESYVAPKSVKYNNSFGDVTLYRLRSTAPEMKKKVKSKLTKEMRDFATYERVRKQIGKLK